MGRVKDTQIEMFEKFVDDMSPAGKAMSVRDQLQNHLTVSVDITNSGKSVILEMNDAKTRDTAIMFLSEDDALHLASLLVTRASELK